MDPQGQLGKVLGVASGASQRSAIDLLLDSVLGDSGADPSGAEALDPPRGPRGALPTSRTRIPQLDLIVANKSLALFPTWSECADEDFTNRLANTLEGSPEADAYDFVFFDAPPSFGPLTLNVLRAADELVIPVPLTYLALDGCVGLLRTVRTVRTRYAHPGLRISMVIPTFYRRTRLAHQILDRLKSRFPKEIAHTVVGFHVKIDEAQSLGLSICDPAPRPRGATAMAALAEELELRAVPARGEG